MNLLYGNPPVTTKNAELSVITFDKAYELIKKDKKLKAATEKIRSIKDHTEKKKAKATLLPYILPFKYSKLIRNASNFESANVLGFEVDHVENLEEVIEIVEKDPRVFMLYTSVSGDGFKFFVKLDCDVTSEYHLRLYNVFRLMFNKDFEITLDPSSKDMARVQYLSFDPNAYFNVKAEKLYATQVIEHLKIYDESPIDKKDADVYDYEDKDIKRAIKHIRKNGFLDNKDEQTWWELSMSIASLGEAGREYFLLLSQDHPLYPEDTHNSLNKRYDRFIQTWGNYHDEDRVLNMNAFFNKIEKLYKFKLPKKNKEGKKSLELLLADKFTAKFKDLLLFDHSKTSKGKSYGWYFWDSKQFCLSKKGEISDYYLKFIEEEKTKAIQAAQEQKMKEDKIGMTDSTDDIPVNLETATALSLAQISKAESRRLRDLTLSWASERDGLGVLPDELDQDPELFNCLNGIINLRTGKAIDHTPKMKMTKLAPVIYQKNAKAHSWEQFILKISFGSVEIANYIQEAVGYSLTGHTSEQALFFLYGIGANGKSTFLEGLKLVFGDYQIHSNYETFTSIGRDGNSHSEDVVRLKGSRLVISTEINAHKSLNESVIKQITSGDTVTARDLHSSSIEFKPTFKLWIAGNHKPKIQNFDHGIKRRIFIIPFEYTFTKEEIRPQYEVIEDFKLERSGILNWALEGARRWFKNKRLAVPQAVLDTTQKYFLENNIIEQYLNDTCILFDKNKPNAIPLFDEAKTLYQTYLDYTNLVNEERLGRNQFYMRLEELGYKRDTLPGTGQLIFRGLKIKTGKEEITNSNNGTNKKKEKMQV